MATTHRVTLTGNDNDPSAAHAPSTVEAGTISPLAGRAVAAVRIAFGLTFLWAFFDKLLALGFSTGTDPEGVVDRFGDAAWVNGGSPTNGFLAFGAEGPFADFYQSIAGAVWADWLFMLGLLGIGTALVLGIGVRAACAAGTLLYVLMWTVVLPPANNPVLDEHLLGALTLVALATLDAGRRWGLGRTWASTDLVRTRPWLR